MSGDAFGLALANACLLAAGAGVTGACGWWSGRRGVWRALGVSYLAGVAAFGVVAQLLYVLGASLTRDEVIGLCALLASGVLVGLRQPGDERPLRLARPPLLAFALGAMLVLLLVDLWFQPLWAFDAWTFWTPKAHALYALGGLDAGWFGSAGLTSPDYPILLPAVEAAGFRFSGYETTLLDVQSWLLFVGLIAAIVEVGRGRTRRSVLWAVAAMLVLAPSVADQLAAAEADVPLAVFFAAAGLCAYVWLTERRAAALALAGVLAAGAAATKVEGSIFVVALFGSLSLAVLRSSRRAGAVTASVGVAALGVGVLPWRLWIAAHGIASQASLGRISSAGLARHVDRIPHVAGYLSLELVDPRRWILLVPLGLAVTAVAWRRRVPASAFVLATFALALLGLGLAYWSTPLDLQYQLATSGRRVVTGPVFFLCALAPLLARDR